MDILLENNNKLIEASYKNDNYKVIQGLSDNHICVVFFSGNGLYYPNTEECFRETILYKDRYEWARVSSILCDYVSRIILIRDVHKSWYVDGINTRIDTVDKLIEELKDLCSGYEVYTFGNSAGGYMAMLAGMKLGAKRIYNWGGQVDLNGNERVMSETVFLGRARNIEQKNRYFSLTDMLKNNKIPIYSFYSKRSDLDIENIENIKNLPFVYLFEMDSDQHGQGFMTDVYINLVQIGEDKLKKIANDSCGEKILPDDLGKRINELTEESVRYKMEKKEETFLSRTRKRLGRIKRRIMSNAK